MIEENNSIQLFLKYSEALDFLARGEEPKNQESLPLDKQLHVSSQGKKVVDKVESVVSQLSAEKWFEKVNSSDLVLFLKRWERYLDSPKFKLKDIEKAKLSHRIVRHLYSNNLLFLIYLETLQSWIAGEEPICQRGLPCNKQIRQTYSGKILSKRVEHVVGKIFDAEDATSVPSSDIALFLERWEMYAVSSKSLTLQEKGRVSEHLVGNNLVNVPIKLLEVLEKRSAKSLSGTELRSLEQALDDIRFESPNFIPILYSFCFTYLGALLGSRLQEAGVRVILNPATAETNVDWNNISLSSPEAISMAAQYQAAKKIGATKKILRELLTDLSSYDEESRKVMTICVLDFLWDKVSDIDVQLWGNVSFDSLEELSHKNIFHPLIRKALTCLDTYWDAVEEEQKTGEDEYKAELQLQRKEVLLQRLLICARIYKEQFPALNSLYKNGYELFQEACSFMKGFIPKAGKNLPAPEKFAQNVPFDTSLDILRQLIPTKLEEMVPLVTGSSFDRNKRWFTHIFGSEKNGEKVLYDFIYEAAKEKKRSVEEAVTEDVASTFLPKNLFAPQKRAAVQKSVKKKKKTSTIAQITTSISKLDLSSVPTPDSSPEPRPPSPSPSTTQVADPTGPSLKSKRKSRPKPKPLPVQQKPNALWVSPNCLEGCAKDILKGLELPEMVLQTHVKKRFDQKTESFGEVPWEIRSHTYPTIIASLIKAYTNPHVKSSEHRSRLAGHEVFDEAYSCVGTIEDYGRGKKPVVVRFTEGFLSETTKDGPKGALYHHCSYVDSAGGCINKFQRNAAFYDDAEFEDLLEEEDGKEVLNTRPFARFRVTFGKNSCLVDDLVDQNRYKLAFMV